MLHRQYRPVDRWIGIVDGALRALAPAEVTARPDPARGVADGPLTPSERTLAGRLMRVNHAGEVAAQGLYTGQAITARDPGIGAHLQQAAAQEREHLRWCRSALRSLGARRSLLDPLWFAGSAVIGAIAGLTGDARSLGFVAETERQVEAHLHGHLSRLPAGASRSRAVVEAMRADEATHGAQAMRLGGQTLPFPVPQLMRATARVMTLTAHRL